MVRIMKRVGRERTLRVKEECIERVKRRESKNWLLCEWRNMERISRRKKRIIIMKMGRRERTLRVEEECSGGE